MIDYDLMTTVTMILVCVGIVSIAIVFTFNEKGGKQK